LAQSEKQQQMQTSKQEGKQPKSAKKAPPEKKGGSSDILTISEQELVSELTKMKAITPYQVASRYNVKVSLAKDILERLKNRGQIRMVASSGGMKVYSPLSV